MGGHDQSDLILQSLKGRCYSYPILARIGDNRHTPPSFCALAFYNGREDRNTDARVDTADVTSDKIFGEVWYSVTLKFCRRFCAGRAT